jgi:hypothetical protein
MFSTWVSIKYLKKHINFVILVRPQKKQIPNYGVHMDEFIYLF